MGFEESFTAFTTGVGEKFKGNTEVMKLRSQISSEQKQVDELFKNLGRNILNFIRLINSNRK